MINKVYINIRRAALHREKKIINRCLQSSGENEKDRKVFVCVICSMITKSIKYTRVGESRDGIEAKSRIDLVFVKDQDAEVRDGCEISEGGEEIGILDHCYFIQD